MPDAPEPQSPQPVSLTAAQAAILLKGDLRNLAKKVQQGKTLSASERNLLQSTLAGETPTANEFAKNAVQLADILGVDRKTVHRWRKIESNPGVRPDGRYHEENVWGNDTGENGNSPAPSDTAATPQEKKLSLAELLGGDIPVVSGKLTQLKNERPHQNIVNFLDYLAGSFVAGLDPPQHPESVPLQSRTATAWAPTSSQPWTNSSKSGSTAPAHSITAEKSPSTKPLRASWASIQFTNPAMNRLLTLSIATLERVSRFAFYASIKLEATAMKLRAIRHDRIT